MRKYIRKDNGKSLSDFEFQYLEGLMLGDGYLAGKLSSARNPYLSVTRSINDREYMLDHQRIFSSYCTNNAYFEYNHFDSRADHNKIYYGCNLHTKCCSEFFNTYIRWYKSGKKTVPPDLILTPIVCAIWFCDDGYINNRNKRNKNNHLELELCTNGFSKEDVIILSNNLSELLQENFRATKCKDEQYVISAGHRSTVAFIKYIKDFIPYSMKRKITWHPQQLEQDFNSYNLPHKKFRQDYHLSNLELKICELLKTNYFSAKEIILNSTASKNTVYAFLQKFTKKKFLIKKNNKYKLNDLGLERHRK